MDSDITSLNPFNLCCGPDYEVMSLIYDTAWQWDNDTLAAAPGFIQTWEHSEDYMDWTLHTVEGATWHDGEPATADDLAFSMALIADYQMPFFKDYFPFEPTFEVVDDTTVIWHSTEPTFAPEVPAYAPVLPQHIWEPLLPEGDPRTSPTCAKDARASVKEFENDEPIGTGAFKLQEYDNGQFIDLVANDAYWGTKPKAIEEVVFHVYGNQEAMVQALKNGELDFAEGLNADPVQQPRGRAQHRTHIGDGGCWGNIAWNFGGQKEAGGSTEDTADPVIHELAFRQAVSKAVDRQEIVDKVYQGTADRGVQHPDARHERLLGDRHPRGAPVRLRPGGREGPARRSGHRRLQRGRHPRMRGRGDQPRAPGDHRRRPVRSTPGSSCRGT